MTYSEQFDLIRKNIASCNPEDLKKLATASSIQELATLYNARMMMGSFFEIPINSNPLETITTFGQFGWLNPTLHLQNTNQREQ